MAAKKTKETGNVVTAEMGSPNSEPQWKFFLVCCGGTGRTRTCTTVSTMERISNPLQYLLCLLFRIAPFLRLGATALKKGFWWDGEASILRRTGLQPVALPG